MCLVEDKCANSYIRTIDEPLSNEDLEIEDETHLDN